jgi:hypothetical protein
VPRLTALLLAVAVFVAAVWLRGRYVSDAARVNVAGETTLHVFSGQGSVAFAVTSGGEFFKDKKEWWAYSAGRPPIDFHARWTNLGDETRFNSYGFVVIREPTRGTVFGLLAPALPLACAIAGFTLARLAWYRLYTRRRRRILSGMCPDCGHDMRTLAERCANCGRPRVRGGWRIGKARNEPPVRRVA